MSSRGFDLDRISKIRIQFHPLRIISRTTWIYLMATSPHACAPRPVCGTWKPVHTRNVHEGKPLTSVAKRKGVEWSRPPREKWKFRFYIKASIGRVCYPALNRSHQRRTLCSSRILSGLNVSCVIASNSFVRERFKRPSRTPSCVRTKVFRSSGNEALVRYNEWCYAKTIYAHAYKKIGERIFRRFSKSARLFVLVSFHVYAHP